MKERTGIKYKLSVLRSLVSPFGAFHLRPPKGTSVEVKNLPDKKSPVEEASAIDRYGKVVVPEGGSAKVILNHDGNETLLIIDDYREREGHTPGAKIKGEKIEVIFDSESRKEFISGIGYTEYKK